MPKPEASRLPGLLRPDWPAPYGVHALFTSRAGGSSLPPFDSLNLGDHVGDEPAAVAANRAALADALQARPVFLHQVHGTEVAAIDAHTPDATVADGCLTEARGVACTVMVADCLPVLFALKDRPVVAAAHAGWRGLLGEAGRGVLEASFDALVQAAQRADALATRDTVAADTLVWLGPCIGPTAFEVGPEVREAFVATDPGAVACFVDQPGGKYLADLPALARRRLRALGISTVYGNDGSDPWCTVSQSATFFSHRRDAGRLGSSGRMAACIWIA
ncbi:peptidoglycan editing factor PgeF [Hydrogenophaga sp.]|uniref:peptidoglycan editing factor PgeF n=1 Tax=Hydrogenophaga sp. TaxID=1904254 RepID=UPI0025B8D3D9|nr:peptidoglycan editing factor PgeF [Hydrogenophaga sp.]